MNTLDKYDIRLILRHLTSLDQVCAALTPENSQARALHRAYVDEIRGKILDVSIVAVAIEPLATPHIGQSFAEPGAVKTREIELADGEIG